MRLQPVPTQGVGLETSLVRTDKMISWLELAAFTERARERIALAFQRARVLLLWWLMGLGARPMFMLQTGAWVECNRGFAPDQIRAIYDSERHSVRTPGSELPLGSRDRWPWLAAVEAGGERRDLSNFFGSLRVASSLGLTPADVLGLFVCQTGWMPQGVLAVTMRDGSEGHVDALSGAPVAPTEGGASDASRSVNFVR
jgi:hypothetical protein